MDKKLRRLLLQIFFLTLDVTKESKNDVFLNYSGHINELDIRVYFNGWKEKKPWDYRKVIYLDGELDNIETIIEKLQALKQLLIKLKSK